MSYKLTFENERINKRLNEIIEHLFNSDIIKKDFIDEKTNIIYNKYFIKEKNEKIKNLICDNIILLEILPLFINIIIKLKNNKDSDIFIKNQLKIINEFYAKINNINNRRNSIQENNKIDSDYLNKESKESILLEIINEL